MAVLAPPTPRPYQSEIIHNVADAWQSGARNVLAVAPTGGGKTVIAGHILRENANPSAAIAHRSELVSQISLALCRNAVEHRVIASSAVAKFCCLQSVDETGRNYVTPSGHVGVASVDTIIRRTDRLANWLPSVDLWMQDEAHHVLEGNKWGKAAAMFTHPNVRGLGVTATPIRADGKGLGRHADGLFDEMIVGVDMRWLIENGYLTDYRIFCPPSDLQLEAVKVSKATGDYNKHDVTQAVEKSRIVGDVVEHYLKIARGKLGVTFTVSVEQAKQTAAQFNAAGVPAAVVSGDTPDRERRDVLKRFARRELLQLVNVDLFGEGFDLPAIEVVSMARPTQSFALFAQQFGRALRIMDGKTEAIIIDHVGNVVRHGLPDAPREWSLDRRERRKSKQADDVIPIRVCPACAGAFEAISRECPYCGHYEPPAERSAPEHVDGDLFELSPEALAELRGEIAKVDRVAVGWQNLHAQRAHDKTQAAQRQLRDSIALWAGVQRKLGRSDSESYRRFYFMFKVDVLSAQTLKASAADALNLQVLEAVSRDL